MKRCIAAALIACAGVTAAAAGSDVPPSAPARVEARSADLLAVGLVQGGRMSIRLSRLVDNAPVSDAVVSVILRGTAHPTTVETDGSYALESKDLAVPGAAAVEFKVAQGAAVESLQGALQVAAPPGQPEDKNTARQLWWWVLNFAVCIGFLVLISRRRKSAKS